MDAVLLARFAGVPPRGGCSIYVQAMALYLCFCQHADESDNRCVEIQPRLADMARRSVEANELEEQIQYL